MAQNETDIIKTTALKRTAEAVLFNAIRCTSDNIIANVRTFNYFL